MNKKLIKLLVLLEEHEWKELSKMLKGTHPKGKPTKQSILYHIFYQYFRRQKEFPNERYVWAKLYPHEPYKTKANETPQKLTNLYSKLVKIVRAFIGTYALRQDRIAQQFVRLKRFNRSGYEDFFKQTSDEIQRSLSKYSSDSPEYWSYHFQFHQQQEIFQRNVKNLDRFEHLINLTEALEKEYLMRQVPYFVSLLNRYAYFVDKNDLRTKAFKQTQQSFISYLRERVQKMPEALTLTIYYWLMEMYLQDDKSFSFKKIAAFFEANQKEITTWDARNIRNLLLNYVIRRIKHQLPEAFSLYRDMESRGLLLEVNGTIPFQHFINCTTIFLRQDLLEETSQFIEKYSAKLGKDHYNDVSHYCKGLYHFYNGLQNDSFTLKEKGVQFQKALDSTLQIKRYNRFCSKGRYSLEARCYVEANLLGNIEYEVIKSHVKTSINYFSRLDLFVPSEVQEYMDFFTLLRKILLLAGNRKLSSKQRNRRVSKIQEEIKVSNALHKDWLSTKLQQHRNIRS